MCITFLLASPFVESLVLKLLVWKFKEIIEKKNDEMVILNMQSLKLKEEVIYVCNGYYLP